MKPSIEIQPVKSVGIPAPLTLHANYAIRNLRQTSRLENSLSLSQDHKYHGEPLKMMTALYRTLPAFLILCCLSSLCFADPVAGRFFLMGPGRIHIKNMHTGQDVSVNLLNADGSLNEEGFTRIDETFGFPTAEMGEHISPRLIFMLDYFSDLIAPGKTINMISGYRSPDYNAALRDSGSVVAKTSTHMDGMALDFHIDGVAGRKLWEIIKSKDCCGIGYYGGANVHLDASRPRFWEAETSKVKTGESDYNRRIYLSTDYDRYRAGDRVRLSFSSVSDFGFGIAPAGAVVNDAEGNGTVAAVRIDAPESGGCIAIDDRKTSHFIYLSLPPDLREGRYRIKVDFCRRPYEQMPMKSVSNEIEVLGHAR